MINKDRWCAVLKKQDKLFTLILLKLKWDQLCVPDVWNTCEQLALKKKKKVTMPFFIWYGHASLKPTLLFRIRNKIE